MLNKALNKIRLLKSSIVDSGNYNDQDSNTNTARRNSLNKDNTSSTYQYEEGYENKRMSQCKYSFFISFIIIFYFNYVEERNFQSLS